MDAPTAKTPAGHPAGNGWLAACYPANGVIAGDDSDQRLTRRCTEFFTMAVSPGMGVDLSTVRIV